MTPSYSAVVGAAWLERGGVKVIANIRGGGEYGPSWHQAALKQNRYKCYEDMEAVAQDLIERKFSSPPKMACIGGSNGGLMVGNLITRPLSSKLFGAAVCQVGPAPSTVPPYPFSSPALSSPPLFCPTLLRPLLMYSSPSRNVEPTSLTSVSVRCRCLI